MEGMPSVTSIYKWRREHQEFADMYSRAREDQADYMAALAHEKVAEYEQNQEVKDRAQMLRAVLGGIQWQAARLNPRLYGERVQAEVDLSGGVEVTIKRANKGQGGE